MNTSSFVWLLSHDEVNQYLAPVLGAPYELIVQPWWLRDGLPRSVCRALVVDLDSVAPGRRALARLVKKLNGRPRAYPVVAFGYSPEDDQITELRGRRHSGHPVLPVPGGVRSDRRPVPSS
jgi:hypothetical protein